MHVQFDHERLKVEVVSMTAGLIARFSGEVHEDEQAPYGIDPAAQDKN
jgi:hypothetical protein